MLQNMCYYPKIIKNPKYRPNKKNKGRVPYCKDKRMLYITVPCGVCKECVKRKQSEWIARISYELKSPKRKDEKPYFVTMTFDDEHIAEIGADKAENVTTDQFKEVIKAWQKRYYKLCKRTPRHWIVNEWGEDCSHRIHAHGIIWTNVDEDTLKKTWKYGFLDIGKKGANEASAAYAVKYITKNWGDERKKSKIFASKGLGANYIKLESQRHTYEGERTIKYIRDQKGTKRSMPQYLRLKLWTDEQRLEMFGSALDKHTIYLDGEKYDMTNRKSMMEYTEARKYLRAKALKNGFRKPQKKTGKYFDISKTNAIFAMLNQ